MAQLEERSVEKVEQLSPADAIQGAPSKKLSEIVSVGALARLYVCVRLEKERDEPISFRLLY